MGWIRNIILLLSCLFLVLPAYAESKCSFIMGWEPWAPFQLIDSKGQLTGIDIDIMKAVFKKMGCDIKFQKTPWNRLLLTVERKGSIHLVAGATKTAEREKWAYFSDSYRSEKRVIYMLKGNSAKYPLKSLEDIADSDLKIGIVRGTSQGESFDRLMKKPEFAKHIIKVTRLEQNYTRLLKKGLYGFISDSVSPVTELKEKGVFDKVEIHPLVVHESKVHLMFSKLTKKPADVENFNQSLKAIKASGEYDAIMDRYTK